MSLLENDTWFEQRHEWLLQHGCTEKDIMMDNEIGQYICVEDENGTPGEDGYEITMRKIPLPTMMQEGFIPELWK